MNQDILFKTNDFVFSYRVAGLLIKNNKILLQHPINDAGYAIPGGHVSFGETNEETLIREFREEIGVDIKVENLKWVGEIFFPWGDKPCHQINLFYKVTLTEDTQIPLHGEFYGIEKIENNSFKLEFSWVDLKDILNVGLYPTNAKELLLNNSKEIKHFIYREEV
jgi:ADP-ribose pyrophosphatase YjhB (NUDIX family)